MPYTQSDLDRIKTAIATGTLTVEIGDKKVTYRSLRELTKIRAMIEVELTGRADVNLRRTSTVVIRRS